MQHRGEIVEKAVRQSGMPLTQLTKRLGKSRRWIYNAFENPSLSLDLIYEIGKIIHHDFSTEIIDLRTSRLHVLDGAELDYQQMPENSIEFWKNKYLILLEKYNALLEGKGGLGTS
jgi:hypothetical protein